MKQAIGERYRLHPARFLLGLCYGLWLLGMFAFHTGEYIANRMAYAGGELKTGVFYAGDFDKRELAEEGALLVSTGQDPQLLLLDEERKIENVYLDILYEKDPLAVTVFWAAPGADYSIRNMAYAAAPGGHLYYLPPTGVQSLRVDPGAVAGNTIEVRGVYVNVRRPLWAFYAPSAAEWLAFAIAPGFAAACVAVALEARAAWPAKRKKQREKQRPPAGPPEDADSPDAPVQLMERPSPRGEGRP